MARKHDKKAVTAAPTIPDRQARSITRQLERMLSNPEFRVTPNQAAFLRFVVERTIAGEGSRIKAYTIATEVFKRGANFDQARDPIVSVQAGRLRQALELYYLGAGRNDPLCVEIPKGTYVPRFREHCLSPLGNRRDHEEKNEEISPVAWPSLLIRPFQNLMGNSRLAYVAVGFTTELAAELGRYQDIRVVRQSPGDSGKMISKRVTRFAIEGDIKQSGERIKVSFRLIDRRTGQQLWTDTHQAHFDAGTVMAFQEETARIIAAKIASEHGVVAKTLSRESRRRPPSASECYGAILQYYEFDLNMTPATYLRALEALKNAMEAETHCDQVCSMLGRLYAVNYSLELFNRPNLLNDAIAYAEKGVQLNPESQRARTILVFCRLLSNEIKAALAEAERSLALNRQSLVFLDQIGYQMILCGEYDRGVSLIKKAMSLNPFHNLEAYTGLAVDWLRRGEYEQAYLETLNFRRPSLFWEPLGQAAILGLLGRKGEGQMALKKVFDLKPDFRERGMVLIKHFLKFDEVLVPFLDGLRALGMEMNGRHPSAPPGA